MGVAESWSRGGASHSLDSAFRQPNSGRLRAFDTEQKSGDNSLASLFSSQSWTKEITPFSEMV